MDLPLNTEYDFENYFITEKVTLLEVLTIEKNPIVISGNIGSGKTHILNAIGKKACGEGYKVIYTTSEIYLDYFLHLSQNKPLNVDVLLIDDIQFFNKRSKSIQRGIIQNFKSFCKEKIKLILTSRPKIITFSNHIIATNSNSKCIEILPPSIEDKINLVNYYTKKYEINIEQGIINDIVNANNDDIRLILGKLNKIKMEKELSQKVQ